MLCAKHDCLFSSLIAHLLERFYAQLRNKSGGANVPLNSVCQMIESQMKHWRRGHSLAVYKYVVRRRNAKDGPVNPIKVRYCEKINVNMWNINYDNMV